jgi:tetratricopeptide (TPR) repeat protein
MRKYHNAILYMKGIDNDLHGTPAFLQNVSVNPEAANCMRPEDEEKCIKANISIYNNLAACLLASSSHTTEADYEKVAKYAEIVIELDDSNEKAWYRNGQAMIQVKNYTKAKECFEKVKKIKEKNGHPVTNDVLIYIKECNEVLKKYDQDEKTMYKNMFGQK